MQNLYLINTFQVGDNLYVEDLPEPCIKYTPHQIKHHQMRDSSLALIINKLQKGTQTQKPLPSTYFLNTDGVLYHCVKEGSQGFEAVVVPRKLYQLVLTTCHDLMEHNGTMHLYGYIKRFYFWQNWSKIVPNMCVNEKNVNNFLWKNHIL